MHQYLEMEEVLPLREYEAYATTWGGVENSLIAVGQKETWKGTR